MKKNKSAKEILKKIKFADPEKNDPTKEDDDNDTTGPKPGITDPARIDPTRINDPGKTDPTRIDEPDKDPKKD
ncbi:MAG: hypothetical protein ACXVNO_08700 [Bacteroidia bacterium]